MICHPLTPRLLSPVIVLVLLLACPTLTSLAQEAAWRSVTGPDGDFTVSLPGAPKHESKVTPQKPFTGQKIEVYFYHNGKDSLIINHKDLPVKAGALNKQLVLAEYERGLFVDGWIVVSKAQVANDGYHYELVMNLPGGKVTERRQARMQSRVYFRGRRMYTLLAMSIDANQFTIEAPRFFSSFRLLKPPPVPPAPRRQVLTAREIAAVRTALKELRKLAAAEAVAPTYDEYVKLLLSVKGEVDDCLADIRPSEIKEEIGLALEAYLDLQRAWNTTRGLLAMPVIGYEPQRTLIVKYGIPIDMGGDMPLMDFKGAVFTIFGAAREHIDRASRLLTQ